MTSSRLFCLPLLIALTSPQPLLAEPAAGPTAANAETDGARALHELIDALNHTLDQRDQEEEFDLAHDQQLTDILDASHFGVTPPATPPSRADPPQPDRHAAAPPAPTRQPLRPLDLDDPTLARVRPEPLAELYRFAQSVDVYQENDARLFLRACIEAELGRAIPVQAGGSNVGIELGGQRFENAWRLNEHLNHAPAAGDELRIRLMDAQLTIASLYLASEDSGLLFIDFLESYAAHPHHGADTPHGATRTIIRNFMMQLDPQSVASVVEHAQLPPDLKAKVLAVVHGQDATTPATN